VTVGIMQTTGDVEHLAEADDPTQAAAPTEEVEEELSVPNPPTAPGPILTLSPEEITRFFLRARRDQDTERWDVRLDAALREIYRIDVAAVIIRDLERRARLRAVYRGTLDPEAAGVA
jgi:hypothetical protein